MSEKHTASAIKRWAKTPKKVKLEQGKRMSNKRWDGVSVEERSKHGKKMAEARIKKMKLNGSTTTSTS